MSIVTRSAKLASGNVAINIQTSGSAIFTDLLDISSIKYEYDLIPTENEVSSYQFSPGTIDVRLSDDLSNGGSLYDALDSAIGTPLTSNRGYGNAKVILYAETMDGVSNYSFPFVLRFSDVKFDDKDKTVSLHLTPPNLQQRNVRDFFESSTNTKFNVVDNNNAATYTYNSALAGDYIESYVTQLNPSAITIVRLSQDPVSGTNIFQKKATIGSGTSALIVLEDKVATNQWNIANYDLYFADELVSRLAVGSGSIFGSAFGVNFFVARNDSSNTVSLTNNDVTDVSFEASTGDITKLIFTDIDSKYGYAENRSAPYIWTNGRSNIVEIFTPLPFPGQYIFVSVPENGKNGIVYNPVGSQNIKISPNVAPYVIGAIYNSTSLSMQLNIQVGGLDYATKSDRAPATNTAQKSYALASGADGYYTKRLRIDTEILGFDKLKPHQSISFDSSLDSRFQGRNFRPTALEYDLKADTVRITAYEIP